MMERKDESSKNSQYWVELVRVFSDSRIKPQWQVEMQYIFKTKKKALAFLEKIEKHLSESVRNE